jgi:hypothetical protein
MIIYIIQEALENLKPADNLGSTPTAYIYDLPEIEWWVRANKVQYKSPMIPDIKKPKIQRILLWTTHSIALDKQDRNHLVKSKTKDNSVDDYGVFDKTLVIKFWQNGEADKAILFSLWGEKRVIPYKQTFEDIEKVIQSKYVDFEYLGFYESFFALITKINPALTIDISTLKDCPNYQFISKHFNVNTPLPLDQVYKKIMDLVNSGQAQFDHSYMEPFKEAYVSTTHT